MNMLRLSRQRADPKRTAWREATLAIGTSKAALFGHCRCIQWQQPY